MSQTDQVQMIGELGPIFIGGLFKSGTSLLRAMLGQHENLTAGLETYWFDLDWENQDRSFKERIKLLGKFYDIEMTGIENMVNECANVGEFLDRLLKASAGSTAGRWIEKTPGNIKHMDKIFKYWPNAQVLHIVRDPRDVLASLREAGKWDSIGEFSLMWCDFFSKSEMQRTSLTLNDRQYMEIRYEALITKPRQTMETVLRFLQEPWDDAVSQFEGQTTDYEKVLTYTGKSSSTLERLGNPLSDERIGIWRNVLGEAEINHLQKEVKRHGMLRLMKSLEHYKQGSPG